MNEREKRFEAWLEKVDRAVQSRIGLSYKDLADVPFRDWFEQGFSPNRAATALIRLETEAS